MNDPVTALNVSINLTAALRSSGANLQAFRFVEKRPESESFQSWYFDNVSPLVAQSLLMLYANDHNIAFSFERFGSEYFLTFWCDTPHQQAALLAMLTADEIAA